MPPWTLAHKAVRKAYRLQQRTVQRAKDKRQSTYAPFFFGNDAELQHFFKPLPFDSLTPYEDQILLLSRLYADHRFDLLGSGWVQVKYGMACRGMEHYSYQTSSPSPEPNGEWLQNQVHSVNLEESRHIWHVLYQLNPTYIPIDWHIDFKSGYRWNVSTWFADIVYGDKPGVDVKIPWELARMQHLVQLAWAYALSLNHPSDALRPEFYVIEFQSQILDFMATNPPRYGVNWTCPMDVAIRATNWLAAYDLLRAYGAVFNKDFERLFIRSIYEHALHVRRNLEWAPDFRGNHYLADIVGLLYAAAYLPATRETESWFSFAARELAGECRRQFHEEGSNFENSTCYHRLSAEMCVYGTALALRRGITFDNHHYGLITAMSQFTKDLTKPDGHVAQIGDNDNGRFFKFFQRLSKNADGEWQEDHLDHHHLMAACDGLLTSDHQSDPGETRLVRLLTGSSATVRSIKQKNLNHPVEDSLWELWKNRLTSARAECRQRFSYPVMGPDFLVDLQTRAYPQFGIYIFRSKRLYLAVRCGSINPQSRGGHAHNDQLCVELQIDGRDIHRDPGSFIYTALPEIRNAYRSVRAHFAPQGPREPGRLDVDLFILDDRSRAECLYWGNHGFIGRHQGFGSPVTRLVELSSKGIDILDVYENERVASSASSEKPPAFSPGYGIRSEETVS